MTGAKYVIEGVNVRFFLNRTEAMRVAVLMSGHTRVAHTPMTYAPNGYYVVQNENTKNVYDVDGIIPDPASGTVRLGLQRQ